MRLQAALLKLKVEEDGDLHIALHDVTGDKPGVVVCDIITVIGKAMWNVGHAP